MSTAITTRKWTRQHESMADWVGHYWATRDWPSRDGVLSALKAFPETAHVVELGCNSGPMLARIQETFPRMLVTGVEVNAVATEAAAKNLRAPCNLVQQDLMTWLPQQEGKSVDVLLTHYTLAYVAPQDLPGVLFQCGRVARQGLIFAEPTGPGALIFSYPEWQHDYSRVLQSLGMGKITTTPIEMKGTHLNLVTSVDLR